ncbi:MAG: hypothetical protein ACK5NK_06435 [Niabella sp.]
MNKTIFFVLTGVLWSASIFAQGRTKQEKGYFNITNIAQIQYLRSIDSSAVENGMAVVKGGYEAHTINGYFINPQISLGVGVGLQMAKIGRSYDPGFGMGPESSIGPDMLLLPLFGDFRFYPRNNSNAPMFILNAGYAMMLKGTLTAENDLNGGPLILLGAGYKLHISNFISFLPSINFKAQQFGSNTAVAGSVGLGFMF